MSSRLRPRFSLQVPSLLCALFLLLLVAPLATALTASPASMDFPFTPSQREVYALTIRNDEARALDITLTPTGPLADAITLEHAFTIAPGEVHVVSVTVQLPQSSQPGTLESGILIEGRARGGAMVAASAALLHLVRVTTPREGAYLDGALLSSSGVLGTPLTITLSLTNTGTQTLTPQATLYLSGKRTAFPSVTLEPGESRSVTLPWTPDAIGVYDASARVDYAGKQTTFPLRITVGTLAVSIVQTRFGAFRLGDPFRVSIDVLNEWGETLPITGEVQLEQSGRVVNTGTTTASRDVQPLSEERLTVFVESAGASPGNATVVSRVIYANRVAELRQPVILSVDTIEPLVSVSASSSGWLPIISVIVLVLVGVVFVIAKFIYPRVRTRR